MGAKVIDFQHFFIFLVCTFKTMNVLLGKTSVLHLQKWICTLKIIVTQDISYFSSLFDSWAI
jgi:glucan phosphoethanolaminetransferase (alkaline phosphatase superfamily)